MSEERTLKRSVNNVQIVGTFKEHNLKYDADVVNKANPKLKGAITKVDFKNPSITIDVNGVEIGVDLYPTYKQREKDGKIVENNNFKPIMDIIDGKLVSGETRVIVNGNLTENGYVNDQGEYKSYIRINAFGVSTSNVPDEDSSDSRLSGIIRSIKHETVTRGDDTTETGRLTVEFYFVANDSTNGLSAIPVNFIVPADLVDDFEDMYSNGDNVVFDYEITQRTVGGAKKSAHKFGNRESKMTSGFTVQEYTIFGGGEPLEDDNDNYIETAEIKKLLDDRRIMIDARIEDKKNNPKKSAKTETKKGLGRASTMVESEVDDEDSPF
jgi:hypothetical protein